jgi:hypothetical protein
VWLCGGSGGLCGGESYSPVQCLPGYSKTVNGGKTVFFSREDCIFQTARLYLFLRLKKNLCLALEEKMTMVDEE